MALDCIRQHNSLMFGLLYAAATGSGGNNFIMLDHLQVLWCHIFFKFSCLPDVSTYCKCISKYLLM